MCKDRRAVYAREPVYEVDGIPVFLDPDVVKEFDEYGEQQPCFREETHDPAWDKFRIETVVEYCIGDIVLDAGCGDGRLTSALCTDYQVRATDVSLTAVKLNRGKNPEACFCVADAMDLPYAPGQFDCIIVGNLLEHVEAPCFMIRNMHNLLRKGGRLILSTPSRYRLANFRRVLLGNPVAFNSSFHVTEYTVGQVEEFLKWCGFRLTRVVTNLRRCTLAATVAAHVLQCMATTLRSHHKFGDPTIFVAERG